MKKDRHHLGGSHHTNDRVVSVQIGHKSGNKSNSCCCSVFWKASTVILLILFIISLFTAGFYTINQKIMGSTNFVSSTGKVIPKDEIVSNVVSYVKVSAGTTNVTAGIITEENGLYVIPLSVGGYSYKSYVTKDGSLLFPTALDLTKTPQAPGTAATAATQNFNKTTVPTVYLFTMAFCPYGNIADKAMIPVAELLGSKAIIEPHYVIYANYQGGGPDYCMNNGKYCSMHGIQELHEDIRELCIFKYQKDKFWNFLGAVDDACTAQNVDTCWEAVAINNSIDTANINTCEQDEGVSLLNSEVALNTEYNIQGSPTLIINGNQFTGARSAQGYLQGVCSAFTTKPSECNTQLGGSTTQPATTGGCG